MWFPLDLEQMLHDILLAVFYVFLCVVCTVVGVAGAHMLGFL